MVIFYTLVRHFFPHKRAQLTPKTILSELILPILANDVIILGDIEELFLSKGAHRETRVIPRVTLILL